METIKIEELVKLTQDEIEEKIQWNDIDIKSQLAMAKLLAENLVTQDENGVYYIDKNDQFILTEVAFVSLVTNIELTEDDYYNFDVLHKVGVVDNHWSDYDLFNELVQNEVNVYLSQNTLQNIVARTMNDALFTFNNTMAHLDGMLDKGDPNKIAKYLSKGVEMIAKKMPDLSKMGIDEIVNAANKGETWKS